MAITVAPHTYHDHETQLTGFLYRDSESSALAPAILLIHGGAGLDDHARAQAQRWAEVGYTVFACDMYGAGISGDRERVTASVLELSRNTTLLVRRAEAARALLVTLAGHDRIAALGYCFGGMTALQLARSGSALLAAVSIHGSLKTPTPAEPGSIRARILVCHGALDPHVPMTDVTAFAAEMAHAEADWQCTVYGGARHGFTHAHAVPGATPGVAYDETADRRSFDDARRMLDATFAAD